MDQESLSQQGGMVNETLRMPLIANESNDIVKLTIENEKVLERFEAKLKGQIKDKQTGVWIGPKVIEEYEVIENEQKVIKYREKMVGMPRLSEFGIVRLMAALDLLANKATFMGPTDKEGKEITSMHFSIMKDVISFFVTHFNDCEFKSVADMSLLTSEVSNLVWSCLTRTRDGGERAGLRSTTQTNQSYVVGPQQRTGWFEKFRRVKY